ncbi:putative oxidoreductase [Aureobasidium sp. EXF-3400]|nr:putative oxidoreductase [Aureobasidium sp. EXF-12344]KAI4779365.1 putative oxidoreductase [Aureobasidium sp. EXF-3400]
MSTASTIHDTSTDSSRRQNILIVGCGIAGPVLATLLLSSAQPVASLPQMTILERNTAALGCGQNIDIRGIGKHVISILGLTDEIKKATTGEEGVKIVDAGNRIWAQYAADKTGRVETGTSDVEILRGRLAQILLEKAKRVSKDVEARGGRGIEFIFNDSVEHLSQDGGKVYVRLSKAGDRTFDLVVGADGLHSKTRKLTWRQAQDECLKPLHMYGAFFSTKKQAGDGEWRSWFHAPGGVSVMLRPSGTKEKSTVLVLIANKTMAIAREISGFERNVAMQKKLVLRKLSGISWQEHRLKDAVEAAHDFYFDVTAQVKLEKWSQERVVLLGDAGYCASPFSGMGTTLALAGAYHLAGSLISHPSRHDLAFEQYEQNMRPLVTKAQKLAPGMPHLLHPQTAWGACLLRIFCAAIYWSGIINLLSRFKGPPAKVQKFRHYDFNIKKE